MSCGDTACVLVLLVHQPPQGLEPWECGLLLLVECCAVPRWATQATAPYTPIVVSIVRPI